MSGKPESLRHIGRDVPRLDLREKVTGRFPYLGDRPAGGTAHARLLTSTVPHGRVRSLDLEEALRVPGVIRIFTPDDDPGRPVNSAVFLPDQTDPRDERVFTDHPLFVGDRIGAVLADSDEAARKAAALVRVDYEPLPAVTDLQEALTSPSPVEGRPPFLEGRIAYGPGEPEPSEDLVCLETVVRTPKIHHAALEPHLCCARMEGDLLVVESPCQMAFTVRFALAEALGLPFRRIRVVKAPMGGTFGGKQEVILELPCALMSLATGLPVRLVLDRRETILCTRTRAAAEGRVRTVADREGHLLFRETEVLCDSGAYATGGHRITMAMGKKTSRLYRIPSQSFRGRTVFTNTTPSGACRGYGSPQIHAVTEIHLDLLARKLGMDPAELRRRNLVHPGDPDPTGAPELGNARVRECLDRGAEAFRWTERLAAPPGTGRYRTGVGLACATHGNGYFGSPYPDFLSLALRVAEDGSVLLNGAFHELGNGTLTVMAQIVAEALHTTPEQVWVSEADTHLTPFDVGCVASRVTYVCGACALELAERVRDRMVDAAARLAGCPREDVVLGEGTLRAGDRTWTHGELVCEAAKVLREELGDYLRFAPRGNPASFGVHFAQVRVDTLTGLVRVTDYLAAHDVGRALNPKLLRGQIYGGVQMGLGMGLCEELRYDSKGRPLSASLSRYHTVNAPDMPEVRTLLVEEGEPGGPFGAKSIGEIATVPAAPAVVNAVNRALGTELTHLPLTPERILEGLRERDGEGREARKGREGA